MLSTHVSPPHPDERRPRAALSGKNIACLGWAGHERGALALQAAASTLGARLAWLTAFGTPVADDLRGDQGAAWALLGQLYDAVVCAGSDIARCEQIERRIGVPVISAAAVADAQWTAVLLARVQR